MVLKGRCLAKQRFEAKDSNQKQRLQAQRMETRKGQLMVKGGGSEPSDD